MFFGITVGSHPIGKRRTNNAAMIQIIFKEKPLFVEKRLIFAFHLNKSAMIQRIQTFYLVLVSLIAGVLPFFLALWIDTEGQLVYAKNELWIFVGLLAAATLAMISIFLFKKRQHQFVINRLNMLLNLILLGFFVYRSLNLSGEMQVSEKGIGMLIPVFSIVFLVLANRAIKKDEDLVKSVDRLR